MNKQDKQSIINHDISANVSEAAGASLLEDLTVQNAAAIKGGQTGRPAGGDGGGDIVVFDIVDSLHNSRK